MTIKVQATGTKQNHSINRRTVKIQLPPSEGNPISGLGTKVFAINGETETEIPFVREINISVLPDDVIRANIQVLAFDPIEPLIAEANIFPVCSYCGSKCKCCEPEIIRSKEDFERIFPRSKSDK